VIFGSEWIPVGGRPGLVDRFGAVKLHISAGSFLQANPWIAGRLYRQAARWVDGRPDDTVVDLYSGVGGIALTVASDVRRVYAVEESELATGDCRSNARRNGISNVRALAGPTEDVVTQLRTDLDSVDVVTLNPPRTGVPPDALAAIAALRPRAMVYLSCSIDTLARDLVQLREHGYVARRIQPADMLPQTEHVECLALVESIAHST
jgi:23S rRNA (uracil1939-C5)-methyltransferase